MGKEEIACDEQFLLFTTVFLAHLSTTCSRGAFRVVMCLSCVVNNFFKHLLLPNCWANLDQTWQECSLGGLFKNCSQNLIPSKTLVAMATKLNFFKQFLKNLLLRNRWSDFKIISQQCSFGDPFQKVFTKF